MSRAGGAGRGAAVTAADESAVLLGEAVLRLLRVLAGDAGCVLILEDLHWADQETLGLLEYLADNLSAERVLCVATVRDGEGAEAASLARALEARESAAVLPLRRLDPAAMARMALACVRANDLPREVHALVAERAEGIPFMVEEVLAGLIGADALTEQDGRWRAGDVSRLGYDERHVPGALLWDVYRDLKDAAYRTVDAAATERLLARSGVGPDSTVVCYGYAPALGFWLLKLYGHADVRILDCSRDTWRRQGRPASSQAPEPAGAGYVLPEPDGTLRADHAAVLDAIGAPGQVIVDLRSWDEYRGERFWPSGGLDPAGRAGHVPSAVHQPIDGCTTSTDRSAPPPTSARSSPASTWTARMS